jgi:hypothetical protein
MGWFRVACLRLCFVGGLGRFIRRVVWSGLLALLGWRAALGASITTPKLEIIPTIGEFQV